MTVKCWYWVENWGGGGLGSSFLFNKNALKKFNNEKCWRMSELALTPIIAILTKRSEKHCEKTSWRTEESVHLLLLTWVNDLQAPTLDESRVHTASFTYEQIIYIYVSKHISLYNASDSAYMQKILLLAFWHLVRGRWRSFTHVKS